MEIHDGEEISTVVAPQQSTTKVKTRVEMIGDVIEDARRNHGGNGFPIDLDNVWGLLGYVKKGNLVDFLKENYIQGTFFGISHVGSELRYVAQNLHACSLKATSCSLLRLHDVGGKCRPTLLSYTM